MSQPDRLEAAAEAMFLLRWINRKVKPPKGVWEAFKIQKPDIARIYLDNARVALQAAANATKSQTGT